MDESVAFGCVIALVLFVCIVKAWDEKDKEKQIVIPEEKKEHKKQKDKNGISFFVTCILCASFLFIGYYWRNISVEKELNDKWDEGYTTGYEEGKSYGHSEGYHFGYSDATKDMYEDEYRNQTGDVVVYVTKTGNKYHRIDCSYLNDPVYYITLSQAQKDGYTACSRCDPPQ